MSLLILLLLSCSLEQKILKDIDNTKNHPYFSGLMVYDVQKRQTLIDYNSDKYFTPASTVKLFTLYASLNYIGDSIATFGYFETSDTLYLKPLADPSFLHDSLPNTTFEYLKKQNKNLVLVPDNFKDFIYGEGWQWDDYQYYYMPEKSLLPIYGNVALLEKNEIEPPYFQSELTETFDRNLHRDWDSNRFYFYRDDKELSRKIPFKTSLQLSGKLLGDTLHQKVVVLDRFVDKKFNYKSSTPTKPLYERLMRESENFMAEQIFLQISKKVADTYQVSVAIDTVMHTLLKDIPQKPRWVDASGLSRYNLFTPQSMVYVLKKMVEKHGKEKILDLMPYNGEGGSLQKWYPSETPYIYAKTGSVSNNHSLCGYMITRKGNFLIFSYMNNNFNTKSSEIRKKMNVVLQSIYNKY